MRAIATGCSIEDGTNPAQGFPAGVGRVEGGADVTDRRVALRRQDQSDQPRLQRKVAVQEADAHHHGHDRDGDRGEQVEGQCREKGRAQRGHAPNAMVVGDVGQCAGLLPVAAETDEHRKSAGELHQVIGEAAERVERGGHGLPGVHADQRHEQRDERHREHDDERADPVGGQDARAHQKRNGRGRDERGQVRRVVGVEVVQSRGEHGRLGADTVAGPVQQSACPASTQVAFHSGRGRLRCHSERPYRRRPDDRAGEALEHRQREIAVVDHGDDAVREGVGDEHHAESLQRSEQAEEEHPSGPHLGEARDGRKPLSR